MELCDEDTAKFMSESLLQHAKHIYTYAKTYVQPIYPDENRETKLKQTFIKNVTRMLNEMNALMLMASYKGVSRFCNGEQIEAYMDEARELVSVPAFVPQSSPQLN